MAMVSLARSRMSRPVRGARIEIVRTPAVGRRRASRPVRGARIEIPLSCGCGSCGKSRPARGARIEIPVEDHGHWLITCRAPQGARGLKCGRCHRLSGRGARRAPQGARGLKLPLPGAAWTAGTGRAPQGLFLLRRNVIVICNSGNRSCQERMEREEVDRRGEGNSP